MACDFNDFKRDCSYDCDQKYQDCLSKVQTLENDCQRKVSDAANDCKQQMREQAIIWAGVGALAALAGAFSFGAGTVTVLGVVALGGSAGALGGGLGKGVDCSKEVKKMRDDCAEKVKKARDDCQKEKAKCEDGKACCEVWNSLMSRIGKVRNDNECELAWAAGYTQFLSHIRPPEETPKPDYDWYQPTNKCEYLWKEFKEIWEHCCKK